jgi:hypothetical protein
VAAIQDFRESPKRKNTSGIQIPEEEGEEVRRSLASGEPETQNPERISNRRQVGISGFETLRVLRVRTQRSSGV